MSDAQQSKSSLHFLLPTAMIVLETIFSLILKHDRVVALQAKKFVEQSIVIKINSYIPYFDIYVQFTDHGILFDHTSPDKAVDLDVRTTLSDLFKIFVFGNRRSIKAMRIDGENTLKDQFRDLSLLFSAPKVFADWKQWLQEPVPADEITSSKKRIAPLLEKIDTQRSQINTLLVETKQYRNRIKRMQRRQRLINMAFSLICLVLTALLVYTLWIR